MKTILKMEAEYLSHTFATACRTTKRHNSDSYNMNPPRKVKYYVRRSLLYSRI